MRQSSKDKERLSTVLAAVAFQDHLTRSLQLERPCLQTANQISKKKEFRVPSDRNNSEYVLDKKPPPLTLAQHLGLIDAPRQLLTEAEWKAVKNKATHRLEFVQPCVICREELGAYAHVLLSCTHVFHKSCLQSFERHSGKKTCPMCRKEEYQTRVIYDARSHYQQKCATVIQAAWRGYVVRCWYNKLRQTVPPKDLKLRLKFFEEKLCQITERMVKSLENDVNGFLHEIDRSLEASRNVFRQFEEVAKPIPDDKWHEIRQKALLRDNFDCPICLSKMDINQTGNSDDAEANRRPPNSDTSCPPVPTATKNKAPTAKSSVDRKGLQNITKNIRFDTMAAKSDRNHLATRSTKTESGCLATHKKNVPGLSAKEGKKKLGNLATPEQGLVARDSDAACDKALPKVITLLSCSHLFHQICLTALEEFALSEGRFVCPVCRSYYQKKLLV